MVECETSINPLCRVNVLSFLKKVIQFPVNLPQCPQTRGIQTMQKDELNDKAEPSEFLEVPWIVCKIPSRPSNMKPLPISDSIYLRQERKWLSCALLSWLKKVMR
jgi:hypothetical protein